MNTIIDFETFLDLYDEDLYIKYMETGCYYDTDREAFDELEYESYCKREGSWAKSS